MAGTEHSSLPGAGQIDSLPIPTSPRSRIHFPPTQDHTSVTPSSTPPFSTSPVKRNSPLNPHASSSNARRRVRSVDLANVSSDSPRPRRTPAMSVSHPLRGPPLMPGDELTSDRQANPTFSDEYDLAHEDPRILHDVQRALQLKARREARLKSTPETSPSKAAEARSSNPSKPSFSNSSSPNRSPLSSGLTRVTQGNTSQSSELDFSPAVGEHHGGRTHPTPTSLDDGQTLDWSNSDTFEDRPDRRWTLSKRKGKDKELPLTIAPDQQQLLHSAKISKIRSICSIQTLRKAAITRQQIERTYKFLDRLEPRPHLLQVVRWHSGLDEAGKKSIEVSEPFTWLKHLDKNKKQPRSHPWHVSAFIIDEFSKFEKGNDTKPIAVGETVPTSSPRATSPRRSSLQRYPIRDRSGSQNSLDHLAARRLSFEGKLTFEPFIDGPRRSLDVVSRNSGESAISSVFSGSSHHLPRPANTGLLTSSSRIRGGDLNYRHQRYDSDVTDSMGGSLSDPSGRRERVKLLKVDQVLSDDEFGRRQHEIKLIVTREDDIPEAVIEPPLATPPSSLGLPSGNRGRSASNTSTFQLLDTAPLLRKHPRAASNSPERGSSTSHRRWEIDDAKTRQEYTAKARLLEDISSQNHRTRQLLNRVSITMRDFDTTSSLATKSLGIHCGTPSRDLIEAFGHDPAAVTGPTRKLQGWQAVEDIHQRIIRQRQVFCDYLRADIPSPLGSDSILEEPVLALRSALDVLVKEQKAIEKKGRAVARVLKKVQVIHSKVKEAYNRTLTAVSVVYPELSNIIALEESYKDQYQQIWEFGMDALTFLLDTVTPFWRTYGKTIGEDVRDFLIVPLYRNEFTGEAKRYRIHKMPSRSFRHWLFLIMVFIMSVIVNTLQIRAAVSSLIHCRLLWIPYESIRWTLLPFFWVGIIIQWWAALAELAVVLMQIGVVVWWIGWLLKIFD